MAELLTDSQKSLDEAIVKAMKAGWEPTYNGLEIKGREVGPSDITWIATNGHRVYEDAYHLIFNHDFARALWPFPQIYNMADLSSEKKYTINGRIHQIVSWQYHLQMMVIADSPLQYLKENI